MAKSSKSMTIILAWLIAISTLAILSIDSIHTNSVLASTTNQTQDSESVSVAAGGGNGTAPLTVFIPQNVEVKAGQTITWHNPTTVGEPHTVTFILDANKTAGVVSPLSVSNTTTFTALPPGSNNEPIIIPGEDSLNTIVAVNARTFNPVVINSSENVNFMAPNANYTLTGTEKYVNSGWFLPNGFEQEYPGTGNTFSVTFTNSGTYHYICILHPWMTGSVTVS
ncbi:plastocyanin/azurin family copper-binding protein [Candidatus Nitrosocosmicus franklandus]|uniref:Plastocyanin n=1 Tax=Candidatus Nitrosocosmicus franklandianus TaxID=1798806 RepID=A0A484IAP0_9ARCH|nr:plastocyanin/azurin family copper-binding protein [Candidatus Nitrosocosmicus franklandus]VFJ13277.1 Plastocyanin [Candidatus Nitrosocosmicus franklandus]